MSYREEYQQANEEVQERYELVMDRIRELRSEHNVEEKYWPYFRRLADIFMMVDQTLKKEEAGALDHRSLSECEEMSWQFYYELQEGNYDRCYANPTVAVELLGEEFGQVLCFLYTELCAAIPYAFEGRKRDITILCELFVQIYNCFESEEGADKKEIEQIIYWFFHDYSEIFVEQSVREMLDPSLDFFTKIVMESDLTDLTYLYRYGEYISSSELQVAEYLNSLSEEQIQSMADTYTEGYRIGFEVTGKDLRKKGTVDVRYPIGFERMVRAAIKNFEKMGLRPVIYRDSINSMGNRGNGKKGCYVKSVNRQFDYDHKSDRAFYLDKAFVERRLEVLRTSYEKYKDLAAVYAGPAVIETFGETPFAPENKTAALSYTEKQQELNVYNAGASAQIMNQYIKGEERSFTIIAYPIPAIGKNFKEIFARTVEINTLDYMLYRDMQQKIIDVLDRADHVRIKGKGKNRTDLTVKIHPLSDPSRQTAFENCVADVNIPVGEVFTSPVLTGTNGTLHVTKVFLNELGYENLALTFEDGKVKDYNCSNFASAAENLKLIHENLLMHHDTLPMGEFAIGTNTTAYRMARDFDIADKLPILIAEKTGPHFAIGDTCYSHAEDTPVYNPDGKEIIARDNEISILRREDVSKAYLNCHTDITIPYDELDSIVAVEADGTEHPIITDGRFVVPGTEELNRPLE
ncbi:MAG: aminopeptidase [Lachnospiraceae bacterium]|nr:aminopeptidase [bacterium]MDY5518420.1 aminopeptidase [Lachnospiraceae bacterium]